MQPPWQQQTKDDVTLTQSGACFKFQVSNINHHVASKDFEHRTVFVLCELFASAVVLALAVALESAHVTFTLRQGSPTSTMALRPSLLTRGLSSIPGADTGSPAEQRDDAKKNMLKAMRPLPTQHYWNVYIDKQQKEQMQSPDGTYTATLEQLGSQIESVQDFWRYNNNTPVDQIKMRESIYLFKQGFQPVWEDRRNIHGGSWTFRVPKVHGPDFWTRVQVMAIGEKLQSCLDTGDQLCGVGLSVRFNSHLISIWHRDAAKQKSIDALLAIVLEELPAELKPKPDNFFYKKHSEHAGFKLPSPAAPIPIPIVAEPEASPKA